LTQETVVKQEPTDPFTAQETRHLEKKKQPSLQELIESLKSTADDIGQISELTSEEKVLIIQFFSSLLKLMQPWKPQYL
jgi:hypothetical protein